MKWQGFLGAVLLALTTSTVASGMTPVEVVQGTAQEVLAIIDGRREELSADPEKLYQVVDSLLQPRFDKMYAGRVVLGKSGRSATPEQRRRFVDAFYNSLIRTYADGLLGFTANTFRVLPYKAEAGATKTRVRTEVVLDSGSVVPVDYSLRLDKDQGWKVYDVTIEGISYLTNYRKEVDSQVREKGLDALIIELEKKSAPAPEATSADDKANE